MRSIAKPGPDTASRKVFPLRARGATLVEVLALLAVLTTGLALALPAVLFAREAARRGACRDNFKRLGIALQNYHQAVGCFPPGAIWPRFQYDDPRTPCLIHLLPYLNHEALYHQIDFSVRGTLWCKGNNPDVIRVPIVELLCPSDGRCGGTKANPYCGEIALTNYMGFFGDSLADLYTDRAIFGANRGARLDDILDGASHTLIVGEYLTGTPRDLRGQLWGDESAGSLIFTGLPPNSPRPDLVYPNPVVCDPTDPTINDGRANLPCDFGDGRSSDTAAARSRHAGGVQVITADGGVRFIGQTISPGVWRQLGAMADGAVFE